MSDSIITSEPNRITVTTGSLVTQYSDHPLSAAKQITLLHTQIKQLTAQLAAAEAALARIALSETGFRVVDCAQKVLGWKTTSELRAIIAAANGGRDGA